MSFEQILKLEVNNEIVTYYLKAVIVHSASGQKGHYYSYNKDFNTNTWRRFNDKKVSRPVSTFF